MDHTDVKKGEWFTYAHWYNRHPLLKVSNVTFFEARTGEFIRFKDSIFTDRLGNPVDVIIPLNVEVKAV